MLQIEPPVMIFFDSKIRVAKFLTTFKGKKKRFQVHNKDFIILLYNYHFSEWATLNLGILAA